MAPKRKETGYRELTLKLEYECAPERTLEKDDFDAIVESALSVVLGQCVPEYTISNFDIKTRKGSIVMDAKDLSIIWAALSIYGQHCGKRIAFHYYSIKE